MQQPSPLLQLTTQQRVQGQDTVTTQARISAVSFTGLFGWAEACKQCTSSSPANCASQSSDCPTGDAPSSLFQGDCPGSGSSIEAGWTFNVGGPASAMAVPEQAFKAGLISQKVVSCLLGCVG